MDPGEAAETEVGAEVEGGDGTTAEEGRAASQTLQEAIGTCSKLWLDVGDVGVRGADSECHDGVAGLQAIGDRTEAETILKNYIRTCNTCTHYVRTDVFITRVNEALTLEDFLLKKERNLISRNPPEGQKRRCKRRGVELK